MMAVKDVNSSVAEIRRLVPIITTCADNAAGTVVMKQHITIALHNLLPAYLAEDCQLLSVTGHRRLRSSDTDTCLVQRTDTRFGDRSFAVAGPSSME